MSKYLRTKKNNYYSLISYLIVIVLLSCFAIYKNGYILYKKNFISFLDVFKPLFMVVITLVLTYLIDFIIVKYIKKKKYKLVDDFNPIYMCLITLALPLNISYIYLIISIILFSILANYFKSFNTFALEKIFIVVLLYILHKYTYETSYDILVETNLSIIDYFLGKGVGAIATSNILFLFICYGILSTQLSYKKDIPLYALFSYIVLLIITTILFHKPFNEEIILLLNSSFIYGIILIATIPNSSPLTRNGKIIYAILIGIISFIFNHFINNQEGVFISIIIVNILSVIYMKVSFLFSKKEKGMIQY